MDEEKKLQEHKEWLESKHNRGVIINDDNEDWGGCEQKYKEDLTSNQNCVILISDML